MHNGLDINWVLLYKSLELIKNSFASHHVINTKLGTMNLSLFFNDFTDLECRIKLKIFVHK